MASAPRAVGPRVFSGELLRPGDRGYDDARRIHNGMIDKRPALIARCRGVADAVAVVELAREQGLELSVRGGGHNVSGRAVTEGGVMLDLSLMRAIEIDPVERVGQAEGGVTWGELDRATQIHELAVTGGMISTTGVAGLTLGGGLGWLMGRLGLTIDNLLSAEVVTADDRVLIANADENADLFWGLRGGGGNFGVVTSFRYRLHPVGPIVTGVRAVYPFSEAARVLRFYRELTSGIPDDLTLNAGLLHAPDGSGSRVVGLVGCHVGSTRDADRDLCALRRLGGEVDLAAGPMTYTAINSVPDGAYPKGALNYWRSSFLRELSDAAIEAMVEQFATCPSPMTAFVLEHLHGAATRVPVDATAFPHREPGYNLLLTSVWLDPAASAANVTWTRGAFAALLPFGSGRRYVNYLADDEAATDPVAAAYGPNYQRLVRLKEAYDPTNLFRLNQNIRPEA